LKGVSERVKVSRHLVALQADNREESYLCLLP
jgi:hypothetical protein